MQNISFVGFRVGRELKEETSKCSFQFLGRTLLNLDLLFQFKDARKLNFAKLYVF